MDRNVKKNIVDEGLAENSNNDFVLVDVEESIKTMDFSEALLKLKDGMAVRRIKPSNENWFITMQVPAIIGKEVVPKMQSLNTRAKELLGGTVPSLMYMNQFIMVDSEGRVTYYIPSSEDLCATDWILV